MPEFVDVIVPRGGKGLIERISREARVPVIKHLDGICHVYVDDRADLDKAVAIAVNSKTQRYGTCNTTESLLVARPVAEQVLPDIGRQAREASRAVARADTNQKNAALLAMADAIERDAAKLLEANARDCEQARNAGLDAALLGRLSLNAKTVAGMAEGLRQIAALPDPVGEIDDMKFRPSGIQVGKMRVPLGVIGIIYEARPRAESD